MSQRLLRKFSVLMLAGLAASAGRVQDKQHDPKVVLDLEKAPSVNGSSAEESGEAKSSARLTPLPPFGKTCSAFAAVKDGYRSLDQPVPIADLIGAPIEIVRVHRYGSGKEKPDREEARKHVIKVLNTPSAEISRYAPWDESVSADLVATFQFFDHTKGVLEESGGHVCFSDYSGLVWWTRASARN
ncbi:MAG: hypothetical protein WCA38_21690 [Candidatus Acidiferrales bacterium]